MKSRVGIILTSGNLDKVMPAFHLATTSASMGIESGIFFASYGINVLHKENVKHLPLSLDGAVMLGMKNPELLDKSLREVVQLSTEMFKERLKQNKVPPLEEMVKMAIDLGVKLFPCQNAVKSMGFDKSDLFEGIEEPVGAAAFLQYINSAEKPLIFNF